MRKKKSPLVVLDFFIGKIAPFMLYEMEYNSLFDLVESHKNNHFYKKVNPAGQIVVIGTVAQFEAFCKHQFAALINIYPDLLEKFTRKRNQTNIELSSVVSMQGVFEKNVGFVLAEQYDFGTPKLVNDLFRDLVDVTPFSQAESKKFNSILFQRNLLVHHGGYYTLQFLKKNSLPKEIREKAFRESVIIDTEDCHQITEFLFEMAIKVTRTTTTALRKKIKKKTAIQNEAIEHLFQALYDTLDEEA